MLPVGRVRQRAPHLYRRGLAHGQSPLIGDGCSATIRMVAGVQDGGWRRSGWIPAAPLADMIIAADCCWQGAFLGSLCVTAVAAWIGSVIPGALEDHMA